MRLFDGWMATGCCAAKGFTLHPCSACEAMEKLSAKLFNKIFHVKNAFYWVCAVGNASKPGSHYLLPGANVCRLRGIEGVLVYDTH